MKSIDEEVVSLAKTLQELSVTSFEKIWNNEEDAVYDKL